MLKKLFLTLVFLGWISTGFCGLEEFKNLPEITTQRTYNQKVYDVGQGKKRYQIHTAHINYKDFFGNFQDIDITLSQDIDKKWKLTKASYHPTIPEYADDWFEFYNAYEGANHTLKAKPICQHIKGKYFKGDDGNGVLYKDAFGAGVDLKVYAYWAGLKKVIIINEKPADISKDLTFDFELELPSGKDKVKDKKGKVWNKQSMLNFKDKVLLIGDDDKESYFRNAMVWDSGQPNGINQPVDIELYKQGNKIFLRKTIKAEILQKAVYPLYTDHPTSYYTGAGDGNVAYNNYWYWNDTHDAATGTNAIYTLSSTYVMSRNAGAFDYTIRRVFLPIDTSGIDDSATITAASLYLYAVSISDGDNDGDDWINVVQTSQASPNSLITADYDQCGAINNPTEGATRIDLGNITTSAYNSWTLNATGISWIDKVNANNTLLGLREGHDAIDSVIADNGNNNFEPSTSEDTSGTKDPYLDVTTSGGAARRIILIQ